MRSWHGNLSPFGSFHRAGASGLALYAVLGYRPTFVADMVDDAFYSDTSRSTFDDIFTTSRLGNATMTDSDGLLKWAPHNLALNSATPATQSITVISGVDYTVECTGSGSITLSGAGTGTVTEGNPIEVTASTTSLTLTVVGYVDLMWCYRSDLGGMAPVPADARVAGSTSYVPTTSTAVYLPRRHNHVYNGTALVAAGTLIETEARTNLNSYSMAAASWSKSGLGITATSNNSRDRSGGTTFARFISGIGISDRIANACGATTLNQTYVVSCVVDTTLSDSNSDCELIVGAVNSHRAYATFNPTNPSGITYADTGTNWAALGAYANDLGNGFWCVWLVATAITGGTTLDVGLWNRATNSVTMYAGEFQLETGSVPSSYIPTNGSTVTRAADTSGLTVDSSIVPWGDAVCIQMKGRMTYADEDDFQQVIFSRRFVDLNNQIVQRLRTTGTDVGEVQFFQREGGTSNAVISANEPYSPGINVPFNIASRHGSTFINGAVDGVALTADLTPVALPDLSSVNMQIGLDFMGNIEEVRLWAVDLGDTGLEAATS